jgi:hypothetical protein
MSIFSPGGIRFWLVVLVIFVLAAFGTWVSGALTPWSPVNNWTDSIDIHSGRIRHERYFLYRRISDTTEDGVLTKALEPSDLVGVVPEWHAVNTFSPGVHHSPHYRFHGAFYDINQLQMQWEMGHFTPAAKRVTAKHALACWEAAGGDLGSSRDLRNLMDVTMKAVQGDHSVDVGDLPAEWQ